MTNLKVKSEILYSELRNVVKFLAQICFFILENLPKLKRASVAVTLRKVMPRVETNETCSWKVQKKASSSQFDRYLFEGLTNVLSSKRDHFIKCAKRYWKSPIFQNTNIAFPSNFQINTFPVWYTSVSAQIKLVIGGISIVFEDIKISLGLCISARKDQAKLFKNCNIVFTSRRTFSN